MPGVSVDVVNVATPDPLSGAVPSVVVPSRNVTSSPDGGGDPPAAVTVATNDTDWPKFEGLGLAGASAVVVAVTTVAGPVMLAGGLVWSWTVTVIVNPPAWA